MISAEANNPRRRPWWQYAIPAGLVIVVLAAAGVAIAAATSKPGLTSDPSELARLTLPFGGGTVRTVSVTGGREQQLIQTTLRNGRITPTAAVPVGERVHVVVTVQRPGWISWLTGATQQVRLTLTTPYAHLRSHYLTTRPGDPLTVRFATPVSSVAYGPSPHHLHRHVLPQPTTSLRLDEPGDAGTFYLAAAPRAWEHASASPVSYFPAGATATAVANPAPGTAIAATSRITLTFSKPVTKVLHRSLPTVSPQSAGAWRELNPHAIEYVPTGYGYGLGADVSIALPSGIHLVGGQPHGSDPVGHWKVPPGSTLRLHQLLALTGYLPFDFTYASGAEPKPTLSDEIAAAIHPPQGAFHPRYGNVPAALMSQWSPTTDTVVTRGAIMAFENDHGLAADGVAGPQLWKALISAALKGQRSSFGYTYVMVSEASPETIRVWHDGRIVVSGPANTGIPSAPTATGTYPVFEHLPSTTMSGTNPDGSHYSDPGVPWVSYFNGGDALHGFLRASYGSAQSLGCVEMPYAQAHAVYPFTPIGTLVDVS